MKPQPWDYDYGRGAVAAFCRGVTAAAPAAEGRLREFRETPEFKALPVEERKLIGLIHWRIAQFV